MMKETYRFAAALVALIALLLTTSLSATPLDTIPRPAESFDDSFSQFAPRPAKQEKSEADPSSAIIPAQTVAVDAGDRAAVELPAEYTGLMIQIWVSDQPLPATHTIFHQHGRIFREQLPNGGYAYLLGQFTEDEAARDFAEKFLRPKYGDARVIEYLNGTRIR